MSEKDRKGELNLCSNPCENRQCLQLMAVYKPGYASLEFDPSMTHEMDYIVIQAVQQVKLCKRVFVTYGLHSVKGGTHRAMRQKLLLK